MAANINLRDLEEVFLQVMDREEVMEQEKVVKAILIQDHLEVADQEEVQMEIHFLSHLEVADQEEVAKVILIQDHLEVADLEEVQMEMHLQNRIEDLVRIEIRQDQEVKHWAYDKGVIGNGKSEKYCNNCPCRSWKNNINRLNYETKRNVSRESKY